MKDDIDIVREALEEFGDRTGIPEHALDRIVAEVERLREGRWTDEERKLFLFEATKASYAEGVRAGCEELSIEAAKMDDELRQQQLVIIEMSDERARLREETERLRETPEDIAREHVAEVRRLRRIEEAARELMDLDYILEQDTKRLRAALADQTADAAIGWDHSDGQTNEEKP